jgi:flagellar protein FliS
MADMVFETMMNNPYSKSIEARVLSATPLELVVILYDETINAVRAARAHLASGDIRARGRSVSKAVAFLLELGNSLNFEAGGELSKRLAGLYGFMRSSLLEANFRQTDEGLATTEELLVSLREAWSVISAESQSQPQPASPAEETPVAAAPSFPWSILGESVSAARCWSA